MKDKITVPILLNHDMTKPIGSVTIDRNKIVLLKNYVLFPGYISEQETDEVEDLIAFGLCKVA